MGTTPPSPGARRHRSRVVPQRRRRCRAPPALRARGWGPLRHRRLRGWEAEVPQALCHAWIPDGSRCESPVLIQRRGDSPSRRRTTRQGWSHQRRKRSRRRSVTAQRVVRASVLRQVGILAIGVRYDRGSGSQAAAHEHADAPSVSGADATRRHAKCDRSHCTNALRAMLPGPSKATRIAGFPLPR